MKLQTIIYALLALLLVGAIVSAIVAIGNINKEFKNDGASETSKDETSDPSDETTPEGSETPEETSDYLEGNVVKTYSDPTTTPSGYYCLNEGYAMVRRIDNVTYCYVRYAIPSEMKSLIIDYSFLSFEEGYASIYRFSYDEKNWYLLDNYKLDYAGEGNQASVPKNNCEYLYVSFYTLTDSDLELDEILSTFEKNLSEACKFRITNVAG